MPETTRGVAVDASVLINVLHVGRLPLLFQLPGLRLLVPVQVLEEILRADQRAVVDAAIAAGDVERISLDDPAVIEAYATYRLSLGREKPHVSPSPSTVGCWWPVTRSELSRAWRRSGWEPTGS